MKQSKKSEKIIYILLGLALLLGDITFSFLQHYNKQLDGDIAAMVGPSPEYQQVLNDPFGFKCIANGTEHPGSNRFFLHLSMYGYFNILPQVLQTFIDPVRSVYASAALLKILVQLLLIITLAFIIVGRNFNLRHLLLASLIVTPLIHNSSVYGYINIIDPSITYTFAYALPITILLFIYRSSIINYIYKSDIRERSLVSWLAVIYLPFSGPLIPPIILCSIFAFGFIKFIETQRIAQLSKSTWALILVSLYSVFLGRFNSESLHDVMPVIERYQLLATNLFPFIFQKIALPLIIGITIINYLLLKTTDAESIEDFKVISKWTLCFSILWLILLPLGGYRDYRPEIVRVDTFLPITISLLFLFSFSSYKLLQKIQWQHFKIYTLGILVFLLVFTFADKAEFHHNDCEQAMMYTMHRSPDEDVRLEDDCNIMQWYRIRNPEKSKLNTDLFLRWNIIDKPKKYYQVPNK